jgi:hypothetical protein
MTPTRQWSAADEFSPRKRSLFPNVYSVARLTVAVVLDKDRTPPKPNDGGVLSIIVSIPKIPLVEQRPPGIVDQLIDYKTWSVKHKVAPDTVDVLIHTQWTTLDKC